MPFDASSLPVMLPPSLPPAASVPTGPLVMTTLKEGDMIEAVRASDVYALATVLGRLASFHPSSKSKRVAIEYVCPEAPLRVWSWVA